MESLDTKDTCKMGQGEKCCRYLIAGSSGLECAKLTGLKKLLDDRVEQGIMIARGDNCEGRDVFKDNIITTSNGKA